MTHFEFINQRARRVAGRDHTPPFRRSIDMATKKTTTPKKATPPRAKAAPDAQTEKLRKDAIKQADANIKRIEAAERAPGTSPPPDKKTPAQRGTKKDAPKANTAAPKAKKEAKPKRASGLDAAAQVLAASKEPMRAKDIVDAMLEQKLWTTSGQTPHATIYAAMIREIQQKGAAARFKKLDRGLFTVTAPGRKGA